jgi:hypothetical protein
MSSVSAPQQPSMNLNKCASSITFRAVLTALGAWVFTPIHPIPAAFCGAIGGVMSYATRHLTQKCTPNSPLINTVINVMGFLGSIKLGALLATAAGYPLTCFSVFVLNLASTGVLVGGALCVGPLLFIVVAAINAYATRTSFGNAAKKLIEDGRNEVTILLNNLRSMEHNPAVRT